MVRTHGGLRVSASCGGRTASVRSKRGSASAVVVLVTVLLAVFGVLSLVSSYSGYKLARRHADWNAQYYKVDAEAEAMLAAIESDLAKAAREAGSASASGDFPRLAMAAIAERVPADRLSISGQETGFTAGIQVGTPDGQNILMELRVDYVEGSVPARFCRIVSWRQWQKPFQYSDSPGDLWGGNS